MPSAILIHYNPKRTENCYYADIAQFLGEINVQVPAVIGHDANLCLLLMEDLGDVDLWSLREEPWGVRGALYRKTITCAYKLHSFPLEEFPATRVRIMEPFSPDLYQWERDYFKDNFVRDFCRIDLPPQSSLQLDLELRALAEQIHRSGQALIHRDLQSQNVLIRGEEPYLIDFQGMRFGSPFYDVGSLLCDPYVSLSEQERGELLDFYYRLSARGMNWDEFLQSFWRASAQRLMQALGAYSFLGVKKGLPAFLKHIPAGLSNLRQAARNVPDLFFLNDLVEQCIASLRSHPKLAEYFSVEK